MGNCPNRAIVRRGNQVFVTGMCCDCGVCTHYCAMGAIREGSSKVEFNHKKLDKALKEKLRISRHIVAMKYVDKAPPGITVEEGPQFWCGICGDIFDGSGNTVYFTSKASSCGGCANIGIGGIKSNREDFETALYASVIGEGNLYAVKELLAQGRSVFPRYPKVSAGVIIGSLDQVSMPDIILFPVNGHQMCMLSTAYGFETGEIIIGYAGKSTCLMSIAFPYVENKPVFTAGDHGGRTFMRLKDDEFVVCFPYRLVPGLVTNMDRTVFAAESQSPEQ
jgi:uncharacterized protein (DUF169 family)